MINFLQNHNQNNNKGKFSLPFFICLILVFLFWGLVNYSYSLTNKDFIIYQNENLNEIDYNFANFYKPIDLQNKFANYHIGWEYI